VLDTEHAANHPRTHERMVDEHRRCRIQSRRDGRRESRAGAHPEDHPERAAQQRRRSQKESRSRHSEQEHPGVHPRYEMPDAWHDVPRASERRRTTPDRVDPAVLGDLDRAAEAEIRPPPERHAEAAPTNHQGRRRRGSREQDRSNHGGDEQEQRRGDAETPDPGDSSRLPDQPDRYHRPRPMHRR